MTRTLLTFTVLALSACAHDPAIDIAALLKQPPLPAVIKRGVMIDDYTPDGWEIDCAWHVPVTLSAHLTACYEDSSGQVGFYWHHTNGRTIYVHGGNNTIWFRHPWETPYLEAVCCEEPRR